MKTTLEFDFGSKTSVLLITDRAGRKYHLTAGDTLKIDDVKGHARVEKRSDIRIDFKRTGGFTADEEREIYARCVDEIEAIRDKPKRLVVALRGFHRTLRRRRDKVKNYILRKPLGENGPDQKTS